MRMPKNPSIKDNVKKFDEDVRLSGSYAYTSEKVSSRYANERISTAIAESFEFAGKRVLDLGCGDGTYTLEFAQLGTEFVLGIDPATSAIESANSKAVIHGCSDRIHFMTGDIYSLDPKLSEQAFDCIVLRGVLHHLPNPQAAIHSVSSFANTLIIVEPNGYNPVLKLLERFSAYHVDHEEQSFFASTICSWLHTAGLRASSVKLVNLVPMFCPDWMAKTCRAIQPFVERIPYVRNISCGQAIIVTERI